MAVAAISLPMFSVQSFELSDRTYNERAAKSAIIPSFLDLSICSVTITWTGKRMRAKSVRMLIIPVALQKDVCPSQPQCSLKLSTVRQGILQNHSSLLHHSASPKFLEFGIEKLLRILMKMPKRR